MKNPRAALFLALSAFSFPVLAQAQSDASSTVVTSAGQPSGSPKLSIPPRSELKRYVAKKVSDVGEPQVSVDLKWNEAVRTVVVAYENASDAELAVLGVQSTSNLYVADFPKTIAAHGTAEVTLLIVGRPGSRSDEVGLVRILTDGGERFIRVEQAREKAVTFSQDALEWTAKDAAAKSISVKVLPGTMVPLRVNAGGEGNQVVLEKVSELEYRVTVTPKTTSTPSSFPVFVEFDQAAPGANRVIVCTVKSAAQ